MKILSITALILGLTTMAACSTGKMSWQQVPMAGTQLEYAVRGRGEVVVFVHAGLFGEWFDPLLREPALTHGFRLVTYHRAGYAGSGKLPGPTTIAHQGEQLRVLLRHLEIERVHLVGHSSGALIAMQFALDSPHSVLSLTLLEPALPMTSDAAPRSGIGAAIALHRAGDRAGAVDAFLRTVAGADFRSALDAALPDAFAHAMADSDFFFEQELPAVRAWRFGPDEARRMRFPVLAVLGELSPAVDPIWRRRHDWLLDSLPRAEAFVLAGATHLLHLQNARAMAERLADFIGANR